MPFSVSVIRQGNYRKEADMIYLDNAATTRMKPAVLEEMMPYFTENFGNPSAVYSLANKSKFAIDRARDQVAALLNTRAERIFFTSGGSESDNWAITETVRMMASKGRHVITTAIEHPAVLNTCRALELEGYEVTYLPVNDQGFVTAEQVEDAIREDTVLVSVMFANNEIGTIEPVAKIGEVCQRKNVLFHTDAVQAFGQLPIDPDAMHIDLLSASGHKIYGPKGIGVLYLGPRASKIRSLIHGGSQERGKRAGTENIPAIVGLGKACEMARETLFQRMERESSLRDYMKEKILETIPHTKWHGSDGDRRLPGNLNFGFRFAEAESVLILLDQRGIAASSGSACTAGSIDPSHVLMAIGADEDEGRESIRLTLSDETTKEELDECAKQLKDIVTMLRSHSLLYEDFLNRSGGE